MFKPRCRAGLLAILALALAPASANAGGSHDLSLYKVEKQIDLGGDTAFDISCNTGDYAVDGMFRIDQVDQDNDWPGNILTAVQVYSAAPDAGNPSKYNFQLENTAGGDAQAKLWVTCLGKTAGGSHQVSWNIGGRVTTSWSSVGNAVYGGFAPSGSQCASDEIAVSPGYEFTSGTGRLVASRTSLGDPGTALGRNWAMQFALDDPGSSTTWKTYFRCLQVRSNPAPGGHRHRIVVQRVGGSPTPNVTIPGNYTKEVQTSCGDLAKGLVGGFDTTSSWAKHLWFFGMDPRLKTRAYRFYNDDSGPIKVWTGLTCFKDRTN